MISRSENASKWTVACCGATGKLFKISQHWAHAWKWIKGNNKTDKFADLLIKEKEKKKKNKVKDSDDKTATNKMIP